MGEKKRMVCCVAEARMLRGISQRKLAHSVGTSRQIIQYIENNSHVPNVLLAIKISDELGMTVDELFRPADSDNSLGGLILNG